MKSTTLNNPYLNAMESDTAYNPVADGFFNDGVNNGVTKRSGLHSHFAKDRLDSIMMKNVEHLSRQELLDIVHHVENAVSRGTAQIQDYEMFVLCKGELAKREQRQAAGTEDEVFIEESI